MSDSLRFLTTIVIWALAAGILITAFVTASIAATQLNIDLTALTFFLIAGASFSTFSIWRTAGMNSLTSVELEKRKRRVSPRVERLMDELDDEETVQLAELLTAREAHRLPKEEG